MDTVSRRLSVAIRDAFIGIRRNAFLSLSNIFFGALIIFFINAIFGVQIFANISLKNLEQRSDFIVPLREGFDKFLLDALENELKNNFSVSTEILNKTTNEFFVIPQRIRIKFDNIYEVRQVFDTLKKVRYDEVIGLWDGKNESQFLLLIDNLVRIKETTQKVSWIMGILFGIGGGLLAINMFRTILFARRKEIRIAKLVGADFLWISLPYLLEAIFVGLLASIFGIIIFSFALREIPFLPSGEIFLVLWRTRFFWEILISVTVCIGATWIILQRYLFQGKV